MKDEFQPALRPAKGNGQAEQGLRFSLHPSHFILPQGGLLSVALSRPLAAQAGTLATVTGGGRYPPPRPVKPGLSSPRGVFSVWCFVKTTGRQFTTKHKTPNTKHSSSGD